MKLLFIRHGESEANLRGVFAGGDDDTPLTDIGRGQAIKAGRSIFGEKIDAIISSPLSRTKETAQLVAQEIGFPISKIQYDSHWIEYKLGSGKGEPVRGMTSKKMTSFDGAEDPNEFAKRVREALLDARQQGGTVLIVSHGGVARLIECLRHKVDPKNFYDFPKCANAKIIELNLDWLG